MKSALISIQEFVQQVCEVIAAVLDLEVMVLDEHSQIVAATGSIKREVGTKYGQGCLNTKLSFSKKYYVVEEPGKSDCCLSCKRRNECIHYASILFSILSDGKFLGALSITATNNKQRKELLQKKEALLSFMDKFSVLLSSIVRERENSDHLSLLTGRFEAIVNSVHEGIIATDSSGKINYINSSAQELLHLQEDKVLGVPLKNIFPDLDFLNLMSKGVIQEKEIFYKFYNKYLHFLSTITPVKKEQKIVGIAVSFRKIEEMRSYASKLIGEQNDFRIEQIIGENQSFKNLKEKVRRAAASDTTILILGESGTGKELFARAIHTESMRRKMPFIVINCAAIPDSLLESELFGYEEGAFTGAQRGGKPGKFELANKGTIFLDEIGDMPLYLQAKLLRVLEQKSVERIGSTQLTPVDVRIISATHRNLEKMIKEGEFREDLFYRLNVISIHVPPLRERKDDIELLQKHFLEKYTTIQGKNIKGFTPEAKNALLKYGWPGNVRELANAIEYAVNMEDDELIHLENLPDRIKTLKKDGININEQERQEKGIPQISDLEFEAIVRALDKYGHTVAGKKAAAKALGISLATLYRRIKSVRLEK